jgi:hypothetical protein
MVSTFHTWLFMASITLTTHRPVGVVYSTQTAALYISRAVYTSGIQPGVREDILGGT